MEITPRQLIFAGSQVKDKGVIDAKGVMEAAKSNYVSPLLCHGGIREAEQLACVGLNCCLCSYRKTRLRRNHNSS